MEGGTIMDRQKEKRITENIGLVHRVVQMLYAACMIRDGSVYDYDDFFQTGMIGLMHAAERYDAAKGRFSTYACTCIKNSIIAEYRNAFTSMQLVNFCLCRPQEELDYILKEGKDDFANMENISTLRRYAAECKRKGINLDLGLQLALQRYQGLTLKQAADRIGIPYEKAKTEIRRFRDSLRQENLSGVFLSE